MVRFGLVVTVALVLASSTFAADPYFIVLPGIEGPSPCVRGIISGLRQTHPAATYEVYDWTTGHAYRMLYHARAYERNLVVAAHLAQHIVTLQAQQPGRPIVLIGHSGGGAMSILALERLPPGVPIQQAILLAPDLSMDYPLTAALNHTAYGVDVFYSPFDCIVMGAGTIAAGTIDRMHAPGAGMLGFTVPKSMDADGQYVYQAKLHQHEYEVGMLQTGHYGGHFTCTLPDFVNRYVGPVVH